MNDIIMIVFIISVYHRDQIALDSTHVKKGAGHGSIHDQKRTVYVCKLLGDYRYKNQTVCIYAKIQSSRVSSPADQIINHVTPAQQIFMQPIMGKSVSSLNWESTVKPADITLP